jgi:hypothetical protein
MASGRDAQLEMQLAGAANAAERANRPRTLVIVAGLIAGGALLFTSLIAWQIGSRRTQLASALATQAAVERYAEQARELRETSPNLADLFPVDLAMADKIQQIAREVWRGEPNVATVQTVRYSSAGIRLNDVPVRNANVSSTVRLTDLERVLRFMETVEEAPELEGTFVSSLRLTPAPGGQDGWSGSIDFRRYEYEE